MLRQFVKFRAAIDGIHLTEGKNYQKTKVTMCKLPLQTDSWPLSFYGLLLTILQVSPIPFPPLNAVII